MITCNIKGGLGNMMFQIAAMESLAKDNNSGVYYYNIRKHIQDLNSIDGLPSKGMAADYYTVFKNLNLGKNLQYGFNPTQVIPIPFEYKNLQFIDGVGYDGFFQSEKWFAHNRDLILELFEFNDKVKGLAKGQFDHRLAGHEGSTCAIHVRRGDYLSYQNIHPVQTMDYYNKAMQAVGADKYLVFSDDIKWCKQFFRGDKFIFVEGNLDYVDMALMQMCDHQITCNSSFSWWPAWLNTNPDKKVVGPTKWFGTTQIKSNDILPDNWIKI